MQHHKELYDHLCAMTVPVGSEKLTLLGWFRYRESTTDKLNRTATHGVLKKLGVPKPLGPFVDKPLKVFRTHLVLRLAHAHHLVKNRRVLEYQRWVMFMEDVEKHSDIVERIPPPLTRDKSKAHLFVRAKRVLNQYRAGAAEMATRMRATRRKELALRHLACQLL